MKEMDQLIKIVNRLQDAFAAVNVSNPIDLPQIVVIGRYRRKNELVLFYSQQLLLLLFLVKVVERVQF
jgi:hypothetical protein